MEANNFRHTVRNRFENFSSPAPEAVWKGIEANLDSKKRIAGILWWSFALLAVFSFGRSLLFSDSQTIKPDQNKVFSHQLASLDRESTDGSVEIPKQDFLQKISKTSNAFNGNTNALKSNSESRNESVIQSRKAPSSEYPIKSSTEIQKVFTINEPKRLIPLKISFLAANGYLNQEIDYLPCVTRLYVPQRIHFIGANLTSFVNIGPVRANKDFGPNNSVPWPLSSSISEFAFQRQIELETFFKTRMNNSTSSFTASALYARSKSNFSDDSLDITANSNNWGMGIGYERQIRGGRFHLSVYGTIRGEISLGRFDGSNLTDQTPTSIAPTTANESIQSNKFRQGLLSGEIGMTAEYSLRTKFKIHSSIGYRNYFVQQQVVAGPIARIPHLLRIGVGCSFRF